MKVHWIFAVFCTLLGSAKAQPPPTEPPPMVVGVYAPRAFFANSPARTRQAEAIAQVLQQATGLPMKGRGFASRREFRAQVASGALQFAVVEAQYQIESGLPVLAQARASGKSSRSMSLVVGPSVTGDTVGDLQGKRLAMVAVGSGDIKFVHNLLLSGEIASGFFGKARSPRDVQGALSLTRLGKADAAFTFSGLSGGLREVYRSRPVPLPLFVQTDPKVAAETIQRVKAALRGARLPAGGAYDSFGADVPKSRRRLRAALKRGVGGPAGAAVLAPTSASLPPVPSRLRAYKVVAPPAKLGTAMQVPPPPGDRY